MALGRRRPLYAIHHLHPAQIKRIGPTRLKARTGSMVMLCDECAFYD